MSALWVPAVTRGTQSPVDTYIEAILRQRHIQCLLTVAEPYDDAAYEAAAIGHTARSRYEEYWAERTQWEIARVAGEPDLKIMASLGSAE